MDGGESVVRLSRRSERAPGPSAGRRGRWVGRRRPWLVLPVVLALLGAGLDAGRGSAGPAAVDPAVVTVFRVSHARGLMVTSGGWAYCEQVRALARRSGFTLLCGRYVKDGYLGYGLRSQRHLDWGNAGYLASLAAKVEAEHLRVGGELVLIGVSYSGFAVATLASHHPEIRPDRLLVIDSYLDLAARRAALPDWQVTARDIDAETGGSPAALQVGNVSVPGLARLVRGGTELDVVWSVSPSERREFNGATCNSGADAAVLLRLAGLLRSPVAGWVTMGRHGHDLWDHGPALVRGEMPGRQVTFQPGGAVPPGATCS